MAQKNAVAQFTRTIKKEYETRETLAALQKRLGLKDELHRIECYDVSNISGDMATASCVVFVNGKADTSLYRHFKIRLKGGPDDYGMMREVLGRRFGKVHLTKDPSTKLRAGSGRGMKETQLTVIAREERPKQSPEVPGGLLRFACNDIQVADLPNLIIIDGGKGQLNVALKVLEECGLQAIPVIGVAKGKGKGARAKGVWAGKKEEDIYLPGRKNPMHLKSGSPELMLLQRIRDESHRFAIRYHKKLRDQKVSVSFLDGIPGLGPVKKKALYRHFKNEKGIRAASVEELMEVKGIDRGLAGRIVDSSPHS